MQHVDVNIPAWGLALEPPARGLPPLVGLLAADGALLRLGFGGDPAQVARAVGQGAGGLPLADAAAHARVATALRAGARAALACAPPPVDEETWALGGLALRLGGTPFQRMVWAQLATLPPGAGATYGGLCAALGRGPGSARAVGAAVGANPVAPLLPCHRVRAAGGGLQGFAYGVDVKQALLRAEGEGAPAPRQGALFAAR